MANPQRPPRVQAILFKNKAHERFLSKESWFLNEKTLSKMIKDDQKTMKRQQKFVHGGIVHSLCTPYLDVFFWLPKKNRTFCSSYVTCAMTSVRPTGPSAAVTTSSAGPGPIDLAAEGVVAAPCRGQAILGGADLADCCWWGPVGETQHFHSLLAMVNRCYSCGYMWLILVDNDLLDDYKLVNTPYDFSCIMTGSCPSYKPM